ncbi:hypothetical protein ABGB17_13210 [Sphaerisporangium sp. B11E5]|uniref:hypothetical protein n=1 Tax=Sphaerisporangium sp. B11E5 TaxID=3153563 RepID=UPI00325D1BD0
MEVPPGELELWAVIRGEDRGVGLVFLAPSRPAAALRECFENVTAAERALGRVPELDQIALVSSHHELGELEGPRADYLEPVLRRYTDLRSRWLR